MATNNATNNYTGSSVRFFAYLVTPTGNVTGTGEVVTCPFDTELYNTHPGSFNTGTAIYTVPETGIYNVSCNISCNNGGIAGSPAAVINYVTTARTYKTGGSGAFLPIGASTPNFISTCQVQLTAGDTLHVTFVISGGSNKRGVINGAAANPITWLSAYKVN